jgi:hypothetical protein
MKKILFSIAAFCFFTSANSQLSTLNVGDVAPNFTLTDLEGHVHHKSDYAGKYLLIDMFFTTCVPCQGVSPIINEFYVKYGCNGFDIAVLAVETSTNNTATHNYETLYGGDQAHLTPTCSGTEGGGNQFDTDYHATAFPTVIIIGPDGLIKNKDLWPLSDLASIEAGMTAAGATLTPNTCAVNGGGNNSLGISELNLTTNKLFPNPSEGHLTYQIEANNSDNITINITNVIGQKVFNNEYKVNNGVNSFDFNLSSLESGSYFFQVINSEGKSTIEPFQIK